MLRSMRSRPVWSAKGRGALVVVCAALGLFLLGLGLGRVFPGDTMFLWGVTLVLGGICSSFGFLAARRFLRPSGSGWPIGPRVRRLDDPDRLVELSTNRWATGRLGLLPASIACIVVGLGIVGAIHVAGGQGWLPLAAGAIVLAASLTLWHSGT